MTTPTLYWIDGPWAGRLAIAARPRGGDWLDDEVRAWRDAGVNVVASLLAPEEADALNLKDEARVSKENDIVYRSFPIPDRGVPESRTTALNLIKSLEEELAQGKTVVVHCRQGLGRSALIAAGLLILGGLEPEEAITRVTIARGCPVPETPEQSNWVSQLAHEAAQVDLPTRTR